MSIWDDFVEVVSDGADAVGDLVDGAVEAGEEGLEEVGNFVLEEILGIDIDASDEGSPSEGHDYDADYGDTSDELRLAADLTDHFLTTVDEASGLLEVPSFLASDSVLGHAPNHEATRAFDDVVGTVNHFVTDAQAAAIVLPDLEGADTAIVADSIQLAGAAISADSFESMRSQPDSDPYAESRELLPLLVDSVSAYDPQDEATQTYSVHLSEAGTPDFATTLEDASHSHSVSWLF